jgi:hypothetical protein
MSEYVQYVATRAVNGHIGLDVLQHERLAVPAHPNHGHVLTESGARTDLIASVW